MKTIENGSLKDGHLSCRQTIAFSKHPIQKNGPEPDPPHPRASAISA
jgi:hypothetical protein